MHNWNTDRQEVEIACSGEPEIDRMPPRGVLAERLLLREFAHRTNNELASAIGLVSLAAGRCETEETRTALKKVLNRLENYAGVQHFLQPPEYSTTVDLSAYIYGLCRAISRSKLEQQGIELSLSLHAIRMNSEQCWLLGMILFELVTNAARHAFDGKSGVIHIELYSADMAVTCRVTDNGQRSSGSRSGRGLAIVEELAAALRGTVDSQCGSNGTTTIVRFSCRNS